LERRLFQWDRQRICSKGEGREDSSPGHSCIACIGESHDQEAMNAIIALIGTLVCVCILFAAWIAFTEHGKDAEDWFRTRWGGSDSREIDNE